MRGADAPIGTDAMTGLVSGQMSDRPPSNAVQKTTVALVSLTFAMLVVIVAMAAATFSKVPTSINMYVPNVTLVQSAIGLPGYTQLSWANVLNRTSGTTVNFFTCSTCTKYNQWIDNYYIPQMLANYNIKLVRVPSQAADAVALVQQQIAKVPTAKNVSVDLIWLNLENYNTLRNPPGGGPSNAYGPWAFKVPSASNFDFTAGSIAYDGGVATAGYEFPYDGAQCVFIYNKNKVTTTGDVALIKTIDGLRTWIKANPGRFTYAAPSLDATGKTGDYTGSAFIRHVFYAVAAPYTDFLGVTPTTDNGTPSPAHLVV